jgi:hypothetical protein
MMKRIVVWLIETCLEVLLLGVVLTLLLGHDRNSFIKDVFIYSSGIGLLFFSTGYLLTTIILRAMWRTPKPWLYAAAATALFFIHFEIMNVAARGAFEPPARFRIRVAGACIVFACTFVGSMALRRNSTMNAELHSRF